MIEMPTTSFLIKDPARHIRLFTPRSRSKIVRARGTTIPPNCQADLAEQKFAEERAVHNHYDLHFFFNAGQNSRGFVQSSDLNRKIIRFFHIPPLVPKWRHWNPRSPVIDALDFLEVTSSFFTCNIATGEVTAEADDTREE